MSAFCSSVPIGTKNLFSPTSICSSQPHFQKRRLRCYAPAVTAAPPHNSQATVESTKSPYTKRIWSFNSFKIHYATAGRTNPSDLSQPALVLVHGFGASSRHWRRNLAPLAAQGYRVYAIDLLGFGMGDKPAVGTIDSNGNPLHYTFDYWTQQLRQFVTEVVQPSGQRPVFLVANSIGAMVTMQLSVETPTLCAANVFISPALRQLTVRKRSWVQSIVAVLLMRLLSYPPLAVYFFNSLTKPGQLRSVLREAYHVSEAIDDELLTILREPAATPGALDVFLAFIMNDEGPIPEDFLPVLTQPSLVIWGEKDRFEPFELGQALRHYSTVDSFVSLPDVGHCAHDEVPDKVNSLIIDFVQKHLQRSIVPSD